MNNISRVAIKVPATTANLGPGFDVHGLALNVMYDIIEVEKINGKKILIEGEGKYANKIPVKPEENSAGKVALMLQEKLNCGVKIKIFKGIPPGSGLGSSGADAAGVALAINHLFKLNFSKEKLTELASFGEIASAGAAHADNVAPAIYGGFTIILSYKPMKIFSFFPSKKLKFILVIPDFPKESTKKARKILPKKVELKKVISNVSGASAVTAGMILSNPELIGLGMQMDKIVEEARMKLYPYFSKVKMEALKAGALGVTLSGAGPTIIISTSFKTENIMKIVKAVKEVFKDEKIEVKTYVSEVSKGAEIIEEE
ncbi:MAG: homoserine kinase [Candidatus Bathyarchaeia archaeon]|nr:homoserine kinase [Candidatus Bathyarchaeota archaeon]